MDVMDGLDVMALHARNMALVELNQACSSLGLALLQDDEAVSSVAAASPELGALVQKAKSAQAWVDSFGEGE